MSRPARGAWVEIEPCVVVNCRNLSRPARGAWVEIKQGKDYDFTTLVAPRKGRVG